MYLLNDHYKRCLAATYIETPNSGNYAIEIEDNVLYILFQHTIGDEDWKNNFDFPIKPYKNMNETWFVHRGFLRVWKSMRDEIELRVSEIMLDGEIISIKCIGYSHGGALALFALEDMVYLYGDRNVEIKGYGFGAPRVVWGFMPRQLKRRLQNYHTYRNIPDIVTHAPPRIFGFRTIGLVRIGQGLGHRPIRAHYPDSYFTSIDELIRLIS